MSGVDRHRMRVERKNVKLIQFSCCDDVPRIRERMTDIHRERYRIRKYLLDDEKEMSKILADQIILI